MDLLFIVLGIFLLYVGGESLVKHSSLLAQRFGVRPLVIGLTIVAFGTSAPELAASLTAALRGAPEIALGNVIGSNIANVGLILALTALVYPLRTEAAFLRREMPVMIGVAALLILLFLNGALGRLEGALLVGLMGVYLWVLFSRQEAPETELEFAAEYGAKDAAPLWRSVFGTLLGLALLVAGAQLLVAGATALARLFGVPELIIGLTLVAVGTSLPELATSVIAALKREPEIALGNIVGSNIFNVLLILGATALVQPIGVPYRSVALNLWLMLGFSAALLLFLMTGLRLGRREGGLLLAAYALYVGYLYLA
ncbi:calcium/sodium antiporter [Truepera radiovictrix]|uniref:calcium/sodium antiporter n=1 Tax=Truepera radiovictrix TaxID=332249 RepID=UPI0002DC390B|nr:calcium/sodium antiporter [Truepera radiovictrix]WMT55911.1 calcium/sodium antiporter [Truepera radiovictrix]